MVARAREPTERAQTRRLGPRGQQAQRASQVACSAERTWVWRLGVWGRSMGSVGRTTVGYSVKGSPPDPLPTPATTVGIGEHGVQEDFKIISKKNILKLFS